MDRKLLSQFVTNLATAKQTKTINEAILIENTPEPRTRESLANDFHSLGLKSGEIILVHTRLSAIGWINGGAVAIIQALMDTITDLGTIVMPTQTGGISDPEKWLNPPIPKNWIETVRKTMPGYNPKYTPTRGVGIVPEVFRNFPNVIRSRHPQVSFAAWGKNAAELMENHEYRYGLGESSPLAKMYDLQAKVLFIGTSYSTNTCFHLAEYRAVNRKTEIQSSSISVHDKNQWITYEELVFEDSDFEKIGLVFEKRFPYQSGKVGSASAKLLPMKELVDCAEEYMKQHPPE